MSYRKSVRFVCTLVSVRDINSQIGHQSDIVNLPDSSFDLIIPKNTISFYEHLTNFTFIAKIP